MVKELKKVRLKLVDDGYIQSETSIRDYKDAVLTAKEYICDSNREILCAICLAGNKPVSFIVLGMGTTDFAFVPVGELIKTTLLSNASGVILLHNHPNGSTYPSKEDIALTDKVIRACELVDIKFLDHIIVPAFSDQIYSFNERNLIPASLNQYVIDIADLKLGKAAETQQYDELQLAYRIADRIVSIQKVEGGYDYSIMDMEYREIDGGIYDNPDISIREALKDIVDDLKQIPDGNIVKGAVHLDDDMIPLDYDSVTEQASKSDFIPWRIMKRIADDEEITKLCQLNQSDKYKENSMTSSEHVTHRKRGR